MNILTLCGSLRAQSSNRAILEAYEQLAPAELVFEHYLRLDQLPHFNPDLDHEPLPEEPRLLRQSVGRADVLIISTPEYVHALPGAFKNALDWLVSDPAFVGKPVVILYVDRGENLALASLREVLTTMSANLIEPACALLPLSTNNLSAQDVVEHQILRPLLQHSLNALHQAPNI